MGIKKLLKKFKRLSFNKKMAILLFVLSIIGNVIAGIGYFTDYYFHSLDKGVLDVTLDNYSGPIYHTIEGQYLAEVEYVSRALLKVVNRGKQPVIIDSAFCNSKSNKGVVLSTPDDKKKLLPAEKYVYYIPTGDSRLSVCYVTDTLGNNYYDWDSPSIKRCWQRTMLYFRIFYFFEKFNMNLSKNPILDRLYCRW